MFTKIIDPQTGKPKKIKKCNHEDYMECLKYPHKIDGPIHCCELCTECNKRIKTQYFNIGRSFSNTIGLIW